MKNLIHYLLLLLFLTTISNTAQSQCLCADIEFSVTLPEKKIEDHHAHYSIKVIQMEQGLRDYNQPYYSKEIPANETYNFQFPTGGGLDTLQFILTNNIRNEEMKITVVNMGYDNPYYIDLGKFTKGDYLFDWNTIYKCQHENLSTNLVECMGFKFYQLQLKSPEEHFIHNKIRPFNIDDFKRFKYERH